MSNRIIEKIISKQSESQVMTKEDKEIYEYGYILLFEVCINLLIALIIGILFSKTILVYFFLMMYIPLRSFCGGWHADKGWKCTLISSAILLLHVCGLLYFSDNKLPVFGMWSIYFLANILVLKLAPVETKTKTINMGEKRIYKKKIKIIVLLHALIMIIASKVNSYALIFSMTFVYFVQSVMLLLELAKSKIVSENKDN